MQSSLLRELGPDRSRALLRTTRLSHFTSKPHCCLYPKINCHPAALSKEKTVTVAGQQPLTPTQALMGGTLQRTQNLSQYEHVTQEAVLKADCKMNLFQARQASEYSSDSFPRSGGGRRGITGSNRHQVTLRMSYKETRDGSGLSAVSLFPCTCYKATSCKKCFLHQMTCEATSYHCPHA